MNGPGDYFVMRRVVSGFNEWLRIHIEVRRPIHKSNGKEEGLFSKQADLGAEDPFVRLEPAKHGYLSPIRQTEFGLQLVRVGNPFILNLETQRQLSFRLQVGRHDLA